MRYRDIKLVEATPTDRADYSRGRFSTEPADEKLVRTYCDAIKKGKETSQNFNNPKWLNRAIATAEKFAKDNPQYASQIAQCISTARAGGGDGGAGAAGALGSQNAQGSAGTGDGTTANGDGTTANGGGITGIPGNQNNTGVTGGGQGSNKLKAAADELSRLLDKEDWQGAKDLINGNPDLQATVPSSLKKDLDAAVQAQTDAAESNRLAQEAADAKVAADKKAAQDKADTEAQAAAEAAAESNRLAQEEKRLADEAEQKRNATAKAEADAAEAKRQSDAAEAKRLADAAEANRKAAEQLEADKEEAAKAAADAKATADAKAAADAKATADAKAAADAKPGSTPPTEKPTTNQDSFDWEDL
jgi:chemotaxis protein histidine kinase CheA